MEKVAVIQCAHLTISGVSAMNWLEHRSLEGHLSICADQQCQLACRQSNGTGCKVCAITLHHKGRKKMILVMGK